jgi:hypothetical protein
MDVLLHPVEMIDGKAALRLEAQLPMYMPTLVQILEPTHHLRNHHHTKLDLPLPKKAKSLHPLHLLWDLVIMPLAQALDPCRVQHGHAHPLHPLQIVADHLPHPDGGGMIVTVTVTATATGTEEIAHSLVIDRSTDFTLSHARTGQEIGVISEVYHLDEVTMVAIGT